MSTTLVNKWREALLAMVHVPKRRRLIIRVLGLTLVIIQLATGCGLVKEVPVTASPKTPDRSAEEELIAKLAELCNHGIGGGATPLRVRHEVRFDSIIGAEPLIGSVLDVERDGSSVLIRQSRIDDQSSALVLWSEEFVTADVAIFSRRRDSSGDRMARFATRRPRGNAASHRLAGSVFVNGTCDADPTASNVAIGNLIGERSVILETPSTQVVVGTPGPKDSPETKVILDDRGRVVSVRVELDVQFGPMILESTVAFPDESSAAPPDESADVEWVSLDEYVLRRGST